MQILAYTQFHRPLLNQNLINRLQTLLNSFKMQFPCLFFSQLSMQTKLLNSLDNYGMRRKKRCFSGYRGWWYTNMEFTQNNICTVIYKYSKVHLTFPTVHALQTPGDSLKTTIFFPVESDVRPQIYHAVYSFLDNCWRSTDYSSPACFLTFNTWSNLW